MKNGKRTAETRVVLDSNVWISAVITPNGNAARLVRAGLSGEFKAIASLYILQEIEQALLREAFRRKYGFSPLYVSEHLQNLRASLEIVSPAVVALDLRDPDDLPIIGTALAGRASHLVTGERDLLHDEKLIEWMLERGVKITSPADFLIGSDPGYKEE